MHILQTAQSAPLAVIFDDLGASPRGSFVVNGTNITPEIINFITKKTGGLFNVSIPESRVEILGLKTTPPRASLGRFSSQTPGLISVESRTGVTTGISAFDRAKTISVLASNETTIKDLISPGHVFPVSVRDAGLLQKIALPEAAYQLYGPKCTAALCVEAINDSGEFYSKEDLEKLCVAEKLPFVLISDLLANTMQSTPMVEYVADAKLPSTFSPDFRAHIFRSRFQFGEHVALVLGTITPENPTLVRVQNESTVSDVFGSHAPSSSRELLRSALAAISKHGSGVLLYLKKPDIGSMKVEVEQLAQMRANTETGNPQSPIVKEAAREMREYGVGAQILRDLGVKKIMLLTQSNRSLIGLERFGLEIVSQVKMSV